MSFDALLRDPDLGLAPTRHKQVATDCGSVRIRSDSQFAHDFGLPPGAEGVITARYDQAGEPRANVTLTSGMVLMGVPTAEIEVDGPDRQSIIQRMSNEFVAGLHFVRASPLNPEVGSETQIWVAATGADQAAAAVLKKLGPGWKAERLQTPPTKAQASRVKLRAGDACEFSSAQS